MCVSLCGCEYEFMPSPEDIRTTSAGKTPSIKKNLHSIVICAHFIRILLSNKTSLASINFGIFAKPFVSSLDAVIWQLFSLSSNAKN